MATCQHSKKIGEVCGYPGIANFSLCHACLNKVKTYNYVDTTRLHLTIKEVDVDITIVFDVYDPVEDVTSILKEEDAYFVIMSTEKIYNLRGILDTDSNLRKPTSDEKVLISALHI